MLMMTSQKSRYLEKEILFFLQIKKKNHYLHIQRSFVTNNSFVAEVNFKDSNIKHIIFYITVTIAEDSSHNFQSNFILKNGSVNFWLCFQASISPRGVPITTSLQFVTIFKMPKSPSLLPIPLFILFISPSRCPCCWFTFQFKIYFIFFCVLSTQRHILQSFWPSPKSPNLSKLTISWTFSNYYWLITGNQLNYTYVNTIIRYPSHGIPANSS